MDEKTVEKTSVRTSERTRRNLTRFTAARVGIAAVLAVSGSAAPVAAAVASGTSNTGSAAVTVARQLADGTDAAQMDVPENLVDELGYRPVAEDGFLVDPEGACSSPVGLPTSFTPACRAHDLGYDLLRVIDRNGDAVPVGLRHDLDDRLVGRMSDSCGTGVGGAGCRVVAQGAGAALWLNTERQGEGAPVKEKFPWSW